MTAGHAGATVNLRAALAWCPGGTLGGALAVGCAGAPPSLAVRPQSSNWITPVRPAGAGNRHSSGWSVGRCGARSYEPDLVGVDDGLGAVAGSELHHGATDVCLDGELTDVQLVGDVVVGEAVGRVNEYFELARCEALERHIERRLIRSVGMKVGKESAGDRGV